VCTECKFAIGYVVASRIKYNLGNNLKTNRYKTYGRLTQGQGKGQMSEAPPVAKSSKFGYQAVLKGVGILPTESLKVLE
jgi:hypothetical protein